MYKAAVRHMIRRNVAAINEGNVGPTLSGYAQDAVLVFPGDHSWGGEYRGKAEIEGFLRRFVAAGLIGEVRDVLVNGPPWNTRVCVLFSDHVKDATGTVVYENDAVLYGRIKWGKIVYQQDFEDTQKVVAFDAYLAAE